jgi:hypothetical protein
MSDEWCLKITRVSDGYILEHAIEDDYEDYAETIPVASHLVQSVISDNEDDELKSGEALLWRVVEYFNFGGSKHDKERIRIIREPGEI